MSDVNLAPAINQRCHCKAPLRLMEIDYLNARVASLAG